VSHNYSSADSSAALLMEGKLSVGGFEGCESSGSPAMQGGF
jgi:hypothetical protein